MSYHASRGNHGSLANHDIGKNNDARSNEGISFNLYAHRSPEVSDDRGPYANGTAILDGNEVGTRGLQDDIVADPNAFPNLHAASAVKLYAKAPRPR